VCRMTAFVESIMHLENLDNKRYVVNTFVASQADQKGMNKFIKGIKSTKDDIDATHAQEADDFMSAFSSGFKGLAD
jgi:hypothetical protein